MRDEKVLVLDTETTGLDPTRDRVVEVAFRWGLADDAPTQLWRLNPMVPIPAEATATHGITDAMVVDWPTFGEVADAIAAQIRRADVVAGYNPQFDVDMIEAELRRSGTAVKWPGVVVCAKRLWDVHAPPPSRNLTNAYKEFVDPAGFEGAHGALADARATAQLLRRQLERFKLEDTPWIELDPERARWCGPSHHVLWDEATRTTLVINFGKLRGTPLRDVDVGFLRWVGTKDFPPHVKDLCARTIQLLGQPRGPVPVEHLLATWARSNVR